MDKFKSAYKWQRANASNRGIPFLFTFEEWKDWWISNGKWEERGVGKDKYCMCRFNDVGPYSVENVYCASNSKNLSDANLGKPKSPETRLKMSEAASGKPKPWALGNNNPMHRPEVKQKLSDAISGGNHYRAKAVTAPYGFWNSVTEASAATGIPNSTIEWRCKYNKSGFSYTA